MRQKLWSVCTNVMGNNAQSKRIYTIGNYTVRECKKISEGGFAYVYLVQDIHTNKIYAMKKILCQDRDRLELGLNEANLMASVCDHNNLIRYYAHSILKGETGSGREVLILMEYCEKGNLFDLLERNNGVLSESLIIQVFRDICGAVRYLHSFRPPIAHRDLKVENMLFGSDKKFKLCDFGSCSTLFLDTSNCTREQLLRFSENIERYTTMMYRSPEMVDLYSGYLVNEKSDIWMLGCTLFVLLFYFHPFQAQSSLAIANASYEIPLSHSHSKNNKLMDLLCWLLSPNPADRPSSVELMQLLNHYWDMETLNVSEKVRNCRIQLQNKNKAIAIQAYKAIPIPAVPVVDRTVTDKSITRHLRPGSKLTSSGVPKAKSIPKKFSLEDKKNTGKSKRKSKRGGGISTFQDFDFMSDFPANTAPAATSNWAEFEQDYEKPFASEPLPTLPKYKRSTCLNVSSLSKSNGDSSKSVHSPKSPQLKHLFSIMSDDTDAIMSLSANQDEELVAPFSQKSASQMRIISQNTIDNGIFQL